MAIEGWENFHVIVGSAAGALIGLQFVVMTLIATLPITRGLAQVGSTFSTPTVIHFSVVLLLSAVISTPWRSIAPVSVFWALVGLFGIASTILVAQRLRLPVAYQAVFEDRLFHVLLPFGAYVMLVVAAYMAFSYPRPALFVVGAVELLLLFIGIHNAWDTVTYHIFVRRPEQLEAEQHP